MDTLPGLTVQRDDPPVAMQAQLMGTLDLDPSTNCLVLRPSNIDNVQFVDIAWPRGWSVTIPDGNPTLTDRAGIPVAQVGDEVSVGGGFVDTTRAKVTACTGQQAVFIASALTRL
ncbi:hypothetical protein EV645_2025 [Kribbella rubisoli]|uniref:Uncharacterized protein n=1 Tax=Kribbella rubisoli TaxID=3075929 RepID=A0A4Q7XAP1_9ACTN|nr:hypothetical protein [Kribbella rubisoli]RZU19805.1 hypothetical protein EV645_2025 [Kribbella rubisoli]